MAVEFPVGLAVNRTGYAVGELLDGAEVGTVVLGDWVGDPVVGDLVVGEANGA